MKAKAYANNSATSPFAPYSFERREPGAQDVAIDIEFCGICHSDIHTARSEWGPAKYPCVPGHEIVGRVRSVGSAVKKFKTGDTVGVGCMVDACRECVSCKEGLEQYCEKGMVGTYGSPVNYEGGYTKGGYSTHIVVDERFVLSIPKNLDLAAAAPLLCAGITTYSPMKYLGVGKGHKIAVLGLGGLGHMGVKLAASFGAEVTVLSRSPNKKQDAHQLGAHHFALTTDDQAIKKLSNHFDFILDTVSAPHDLGQAFGMIKREGTLILVGASEKPLPLSTFGIIMNRRKMMGSLIGGLPETQEMLDHCGKHNIVSHIELIKPEKINEAFERTVAADVKYRFVIDCKAI
jgi:uncharacterized zinc-type alcohol dehydrogenase-like protein